MTSSTTYPLSDEAETARLAAEIAAKAEAGDVLYLIGALGAGKTTFARAFIRARLGPETEVPSPSFSLIQHYDAKPTMVHADLYRLDAPEEVLELGLDEASDVGILLIEWPEHGEGYVPPPTLTMTFGMDANGHDRTLTVCNHRDEG